MADPLMAWVDDGLVAATEASVSVYDRGFRGGEGVFETLRAYGNHPFRLTAHARRAVTGAADLGFVLREAVLTDAIRATVTANLDTLAGADSVVRLTASAGPIDPESPFPGTPVGEPTVVVTSQRLAVDTRIQTDGVSAATVPLARELPHVKAVSYLVALTARRRAREQGADEALFTTADGRVLEAAAANVFAVVGGRVVTPPLAQALLAGVTRGVVLELARAHELPIDERPLELAELAGCDEAFLTATTREVMPLVEVDRAPVGDGLPGPVTRSLQAAYRDEVARERAQQQDGLTAG